MKTAQEVFDEVAEHLFTQGKQALKSDGVDGPRCMYRSPEGLKCAVGVLIPDENYTPELEGGLNDRVMAALPEGYRDHKYLLMELQSVHDGDWFWYSPIEMFNALEKTAERYGISAEKFRGRQFGNPNGAIASAA